jgi:sodium transport system permease protein
MHWSVIRLIWQREQVDLFRDRRTVFMIFLLPVVLYPLLGYLGFEFARGSVQQVSTIGIVGLDHLPPATPASMHFATLPAPWLTLTPVAARFSHRAAALADAEAVRALLELPPLVIDGRFPPEYFDFDIEAKSVVIKPLTDDQRSLLQAGDVDVVLIIPSDLRLRLRDDGRARFEVYYREGDERSRHADRRLRGILNRWKKQVKIVRFLQRHLPLDFDDPVEIRRPQQDGQGQLKWLTDEFTEMMSKFFPFLLIMWALAGALHPAIDLTAGEKERATLETLLLSPATRGEIVCGKFLAVWFFSSLTALWNLGWLGGGAWVASWFLPFPIMRSSALVWCGVITVLLAALFSAVSMALGAYARSTKEGQYYLLPIFVVTMPLTFMPLVPGVELNWYYSLVPITGATLLLQKLMQPQPDPAVWKYFLPVLASLLVCNVLALRWAVAQFCREEVLFRESEGLDWQGWVRWVLPKKASTKR